MNRDVESPGIGLVAKGEMPPFSLDRIKAVATHDIAQKLAVLTLLRGEAGCMKVGYRVEHIEPRTHVNWLAGGKSDDGEVDGAAHGVFGTTRDIALAPNLIFRKMRIELLTSKRVGRLMAPTEDMIHSTLRTIGIVNEQAKSLFS